MPTDTIMQGIWWANDWQRVLDFEGWKGRQLEMVRGANGDRNWQDVTSTRWLSDNAKRAYPRWLQVCLVLWPGDMNPDTAFREAAAGKYEDNWRTLFRNLLSNTPGDYPIFYSPLYEGDGNWFASYYITKGRAPLAKQVFQRVVTIAREISSRFRMILNFAEWDNPSVIGFADVFPGNDYCDDLGINLYVKDEYQGSQPDKILHELLNSQMGLNRMIREAKELGVKGLWIPEWGLRPYSKNETPRERIDLTGVVAGIGDLIIKHRINHLLWDGRGSNEAYVSPMGKGGFPKLNAALLALDKGVQAANAGPRPVPTQPAEIPPATPAAAAVALLETINQETAEKRDAYPEPANGVIRQIEHRSWVALVAAGKKAGPAPAGEESDALRVLAGIYATCTSITAWPAGAEEAAAALGRYAAAARPILEAGGAMPAPEEPQQPQEPAPGGGADVAALQKQVQELTAALAAKERDLQEVLGFLANDNQSTAALLAKHGLR